MTDAKMKNMYFGAVRHILITYKGLLPIEADDVLKKAGLKEDLELYPEVILHDDPRDTANDIYKAFYRGYFAIRYDPEADVWVCTSNTGVILENADLRQLCAEIPEAYDAIIKAP